MAATFPEAGANRRQERDWIVLVLVFDCIVEECGDRLVFAAAVLEHERADAEQVSDVRRRGALPQLLRVQASRVVERVEEAIREHPRILYHRRRLGLATRVRGTSGSVVKNESCSSSSSRIRPEPTSPVPTSRRSSPEPAESLAPSRRCMGGGEELSGRVDGRRFSVDVVERIEQVAVEELRVEATERRWAGEVVDAEPGLAESKQGA